MKSEKPGPHRGRDARGSWRLLAWALTGLVVSAAPATAWAAGELPQTMLGWVDRVGDALAPVVGTWITQEAFLGIRWITACASLIALVLVALADLVLRVFVRRKIQRDQAQGGSSSVSERRIRYWIERSLEAALPPLVLLVWTYGISAALFVLLL